MKHSTPSYRFFAPFLAALLLVGMSFPASALFRGKKEDHTAQPQLTKQVILGQSLSFRSEDLVPKEAGSNLTAVTIQTLPDPGAGTLNLGGHPLNPGAVVDANALSGLRFDPSPAPTVTKTSFSFLPVLTTGMGPETTITLLLVQQPDQAPIARNMELSTYKDVALTGWFDAVDSEGSVLTFQLTSTPARGAVTLAEDGSSQFVYTPYEGKTGKDTFTYVAVDPAGNTSPEAKVTIRITRPNTVVTYADMDGHPAHKAAVRLAEEHIYVGTYRGGDYFFQAEQPVSRGEFLSLAMVVSGLEPMEQVSVTGFYDDTAIPTWCKGYVSSALMAGAIRGSTNHLGQPVFSSGDPITTGEATVMLNSLLNIADVSVETFSSGTGTHWASQAAANLAASGILRTDDTSVQALSAPMTRGEAALLLDGALDVVKTRQNSGWFS